MANILIVDDEIEIVNLLQLYLQNNQHHVYAYTSPKELIELDLAHIDIAILDIMMPFMNGFDLCKLLREKGYVFPIIMLTAKDEDQDKINGLMIGADDYMVKPFNPLEVLARINAHLRRRNLDYKEESDILEFKGLAINKKAHECSLYGKPIALTSTEFSILYLLLKNIGCVLSSEEIFEKIWKEKYYEQNNTIIVHIQSIRKKLNDTQKQKKFIQTVWGVGYKIENL